MINKTVENFYNKYDGGANHYNSQHEPRWNFVIRELDLLNRCRDKMVADFGGGEGDFLMKLPTDKGIVYDGALIVDEASAIHGHIKHDLNELMDDRWPQIYDFSFCMETLEHLHSPYNCLCSIKNLTKIGSSVIISIPHQNMLHNTPYPSLFYPSENFDVFLGQMALKIKKKLLFTETWPSWVYELENRPWLESKMLFYKEEDKFRGVTPLEATNL